MDQNDKGVTRRFGADLILPVAASLYALYYVASVWDFPAEAQQSGLFLAGLLLLLSALFFIRTALSAARERWVFDLSPVLGPVEGRRGRLLFVLIMLAYPFLAPYLGFTLGTFVVMALGSWVNGLRPWRKAVIFGAVGALGGWLFFIVVLGTRFPSGPFERLVAWVIASWN
jgi:hypothetical protein